MYGNNIKTARLNAGLTQKEVSAKTGIPQNTISWIELDKGLANIEQCRLLAECYNVTINELIGIAPNKEWK